MELTLENAAIFDVQAEDRAAELAAAGEKGKQITKTLVAEFGIPKNEAYRLALDAVAAVKAERS